MSKEGLSSTVIRSFLNYYGKLAQENTGKIPETEIAPLQESSIVKARELGEYQDAGKNALGNTVVIKLNGGLGTSMGLDIPKSLLQVREGLNFLDIASRQIIALNSQWGKNIPLILMNSFNTQDASLKHLSRYEQELRNDIPDSFLQHRVPKVLRENLKPAHWPNNPELEWNPPGHGDLYLALSESGLLKQLLHRDFRYAFVSNIDNLGATLDMGLLGFFAEKGFSYMLEGADRTPMDKKGGHLAIRADDGHLVLREAAQCPEQDMKSFQDIERHHFFNTNNIWIDLQALQDLIASNNGFFELPLIRNAKTLDPRDNSSPKVYQLETAMGSAINIFPKAAAVRVDRSRFLPVKKSNDFLLVSSDCYRLTDDYRIERRSEVDGHTPVVSLDSTFYGKYDDFQARFPKGAPSLINCTSLAVEGDVRFGAGVVARGEVEIRNTADDPYAITDGAVMEGHVENSD